MARMRSPNYPAIPLGHAIDFIALIYKADRTNIIDKAVAAKHMGYSGLTGRTQKLLGSLSQYNLLEKAGKEKVRVSPTTVSILHGLTNDEKIAALKKAASAPPLFRRIRENFDNPSARTITSFLMQEGFTDRAVAPVLKSYSETNAFLAAHGVSESHGNDGESERESIPDENDSEPEKMQEVKQEEFTGGGGHKNPPIPADELTFNFDGRSISMGGRTVRPSELNAFIADLTMIHEVFARLVPKEKTDEQPTDG